MTTDRSRSGCQDGGPTGRPCGRIVGSSNSGEWRLGGSPPYTSGSHRRPNPRDRVAAPPPPSRGARWGGMQRNVGAMAGRWSGLVVVIALLDSDEATRAAMQSRARHPAAVASGFC